MTRFFKSTLCLAFLPALFAQSAEDTAKLLNAFHHPPPDSRIHMRWWWFGPAVTKPELARELKVMRNAGIGGVEIQPVYPLQLEGNQPYLSAAFLDNIRFTAATAHSLGLQVSITLGSGWPFGGPQTPVTEAAGKLRYETRSLPPSIEQGEKIIAGSGPYFISSRTGQQVKRAGVGAEGFVLDHYSRAAIEHHLARVGDKLMAAFGPYPPASVFSDSLEVFGTDWTPDLLEQFQTRRGYDLAAHLPALVSNPPSSEDLAVRHDWAQTLSQLTDENFLTPIRLWAHAHHTLFRSQTYGEPPAELSSNRLVDLPEGEAGPKWRTFSTARWASSASHLYGRPVTSTETWTWLHSPAFRATPLDMKAEADLHFLQGINQLVGHGWPYSPPGAAEPGQRFYAAAAFNEHNPWFLVMPDIAAYLQRLSFLLRQGKPANQVAVYLPTDDALAASRLGKVTVDRQMESLLDPKLIPAILNAGYNFDFVDDTAIAQAQLPYQLLIVPGVTRMPLVTLQRLQKFRDRGGRLLSTGRLPDTAPGFLHAEEESPRIAALAKELFPKDHAGLDNLREILTPDFAVDQDSAEAIGYIRRELPRGSIYFIANTSNKPVHTRATFGHPVTNAEVLDPFTGEASPFALAKSFDLKLAPYESLTLLLGASEGTPGSKAAESTSTDLSSNWTVKFGSQSVSFPQLHSWTADEATHFYSGEATYEKTVHLDSATEHATLDFGPGQPITPLVDRANPGMRALLDSLIREAAVIFVNGIRIGSVWHPPYTLDIGKALHAGENQLRIVVGNTAINEISGRSLPDYKLLNLRYGVRFVPQGFDHLEALPSGILGPVRLIVSPSRNNDSNSK